MRNNPGITSGEISHPVPERRTEIMLFMLAKGEVFTPWSEANVDKPEAIRLFPSAQDEEAFRQYLDRSRKRPTDLSELGIRLKPGVLVEFDGVDYTVTRLSPSMVSLRAEDQEERTLSYQALLDLKPCVGRNFGAEKTFEALYREAPFKHRETYLRPIEAGKRMIFVFREGL
ncbi:hypothetical protein [Lacunisphaera limnophila]|uniref:hypothetical protein n=1 Tax=Lacunisphaera limnophila TaxID=1838286 RepID=UPI001471DB5B|nr:hypothetical protein [Lacunisphaera limnophila]